MRFDEFVQEAGIAVVPADRFDGLVVQVGVPPGWEPFESAPGVYVWACRNDPRINDFCANAVLTMHHVAAPLEPGQVFDMMCEQQLHSAPACHEQGRELAAATDGPGAVGVLIIQITHKLGIIDSVSRARIITTKQETMVAELTVTALHDSPVDRTNIWLAVRPREATGPAPAGNHYEVPVATTQDGH